MGGGSWTTKAFSDYTSRSRGVSLDEFDTMAFSAQEFYTSRKLDAALNPKGVMRECCDSEEHPHTVPVILALDVTGSMGGAAVQVAKKLNEIMTDIYADNSIKDVEFCVMGIGDLAYDRAPIQMSQFESDIRIAEQLDKMYFEGGGGGNSFESYTAAWYMGLNHCKLDCWDRGQKGIIITMGDEKPNPYLPKWGLVDSTGDSLQGDVETGDLKKEVLDKFDVYHISIDDKESSYQWLCSRHPDLDESWKELVGDDHYFVSGLNGLAKIITDIVISHGSETGTAFETGPVKIDINDNDTASSEVSWNI